MNCKYYIGAVQLYLCSAVFVFRAAEIMTKVICNDPDGRIS